MKLVDGKIVTIYSIDEQASPIPKLRTELDNLDDTIKKVSTNISNELLTMK